MNTELTLAQPEAVAARFEAGEPVTSQEITEAVAVHLFRQGTRATHNGGCVYRAPDGGKCAVGAILPDAWYIPEMDGGSSGGGIYSLVACDLLPEGFKAHTELLFRLQGVHDCDFSWATSDEMRREIRTRLGEYHGLNTNAPIPDVDTDFLDTLAFTDGRDAEWAKLEAEEDA